MSYRGNKNRNKKIDYLLKKYNKLEQKSNTINYTLSNKELKHLKKGLEIILAEELLEFQEEDIIGIPLWDNFWYASVYTSFYYPGISQPYLNPMKYTIPININLGQFPEQLLPYIKLTVYYKDASGENDESSNYLTINYAFNELNFSKDDNDNYYIRGYSTLILYSVYNPPTPDYYCTAKLLLINPYNFTGNEKYEK